MCKCQNLYVHVGSACLSTGQLSAFWSLLLIAGEVCIRQLGWSGRAACMSKTDSSKLLVGIVTGTGDNFLETAVQMACMSSSELKLDACVSITM